MRPKKVQIELFTNSLIATQKQYSCTELENVSPIELSHDAVNRFLNSSNFEAEMLWGEVSEYISKDDGYLIFDDTLIEKPYAKKIELNKWQWSGKHHSVRQGIGLTNCVWLNEEGLSLPINYRVYNRSEDGMTKNDHFLEMLDTAGEKGLSPKYVLIDSWYTSKKNLKAIEAKNWKFIADIKVNRKISEEKGVWISVSELELAEKQVKKVWLHEFGPVLIMKSTVKGEKEKYSITNDLSLIDWEDFSNTGKKRWAVEDMHRGLKQLCGLEKSYMRKARAQKNHIFCSMRAFVLLKIAQTELNISIYQQKWGIVRNSVRNFLAMRYFA